MISILFENKEILCKENDGSTPSTPDDWRKDPDWDTAREQENVDF